ncbi:MAG: Hsp20/alpha crystallin family protein [Chloroflexota bacterium]
MRWRIDKPFTPPFDVVETADQIVVMVEVAGMRGDDFNLTLTRDLLVISGVRHRPDFEPGAYHRLEIGYGEFRIPIPIPWSVQTDAVEATYREGFLTVNLPRHQERQIRVVDLDQVTISATEDDVTDDK